MDTAHMKTTLTAVALILALGSAANAQEAKPAVTPAAPAAASTPAAATTPAAKPVIAPESLQKVGAPTTPAAPVAAPATASTPAAVTPAAAPKPAVATPAATTVTKAAAPAAATKLININTVSVADLEKLPKIGEGRAKQIVAGRPYKSVDELMAKKILPQDAFDAVKGLISIQ